MDADEEGFTTKPPSGRPLPEKKHVQESKKTNLPTKLHEPENVQSSGTRGQMT